MTHFTFNECNSSSCCFIFFFSLQDFDKPSPPQKPLPADPLGRGYRLGRSVAAAGVHVPGSGPRPIPIPTVPRPPPTIPLPSRWAQQAFRAALASQKMISMRPTLRNSCCNKWLFFSTEVYFSIIWFYFLYASE